MNNNQWTTEQIIKDLDLLSREGVVGFYSRCEITEIFLFKKGQALNLLTLVVFEEASIPAESEPVYLTPTRIRVKNKVKNHGNITCGIQRYYYSPKTLTDCFKCFMKLNLWNLSGFTLKTSKLTFLPKQYVPADSTDSTYSVALNSILKNNFHCGSYLLEGFDEDKTDVDFLLKDTVALNSLSESIREYIPISIAKLTDRLGNIILQFPITILSSKFSVKQQTGVNVEIVWHPKLIEPPPCEVITLTESDGTFLGFGQLEKPNQENFDVLSGNSSSTGIKNILLDKENQLILAFFQEIRIPISSVSSLPRGGERSIVESERRIFTTPAEEKLQIEEKRQEIGISSRDLMVMKAPGYIERIQNRLYKERRKQLEESLSFVQYYGRGNEQERKAERVKALNDIRTLIRTHGEEGVCLWDPYLSAYDILQTLYFCESYNAPLKAISSTKAIVSEGGVEQWITNQAKTLTENPENNFGLNLEFRIQHGKNHGWEFHDRFLIFPSTRTNVKAWSLGTSVNSLGKKSHHILQKIGDAQHVLDAFNELWEQLKDSSCKVWEYKQALNDIRTLIRTHGEEGVCLWDPFLSANDILQTLYFCESYNAPLKAISSEKATVSEGGVEQWITNQAKTLTENPENNFNLNLEFRIQHGNHGREFDGVFLIFPSTRTNVKAWSLGTSDSLGKSYCILQEVGDAQYVLDAFNELWEQLKDSSCKVWKYKQ